VCGAAAEWSALQFLAASRRIEPIKREPPACESVFTAILASRKGGDRNVS
jgi:hypothetical protein